jgi:hypothetical protein
MKDNPTHIALTDCVALGKSGLRVIRRFRRFLR